MADRSLSVRLRAEVDQYRRDMSRAAQATGQVGQAAAEAGEQRSAMEQLGEAGRSAGQAIATVAGAAALGMGALSASVVATGVEYNSLEQTTRAALGTLMGSAEAAQEQMDSLREFVETRMLPREVFIEAQRQLIAFGVEASNVIPVLGAVEDATLAVGGSATEFAEIVSILAEMQSTGSITAEELNELGNRGVNAAKLLGDAMGQTEAEIRESISQGALDGREALATLVNAMRDEFGGAAEDVAQTWQGATGLVAAGLRNVGSAAVEAFIDPTGGGAAVQWARDLAGILGALHSRIEPLVDELSQRAEPTFQAVSDRLQGIADRIEELDLVALVDRVEPAAPAFGALAAALSAAGSAAVLSAIPGLGGLAGVMSPLGAAVAGAVVAFPELRDLVLDLARAVEPLIPAVADAAVLIGESLAVGIADLVTVLQPAVEVLGEASEMFASLPRPIQSATVALGAFALALRFGGPVGAAVTGIAALGTAVQTLGEAFGVGQQEAQQFRGPMELIAEDLERFARTGIPDSAIDDVISDFDVMGEEIRRALDPTFGEGLWDHMLDELFGNWSDGRDRIEARRDPESFLSEFAKENASDLEELDAALASLVAGGNIDEAQDAYARLRDRAEEAGVPHEALIQMLPQYERELERAAATTDESESSYQSYEDGVRAATEALQEHHDELRAQADPVFALHKALREAEEAQQNLNDAIEEHGEGSEEAEDAALALLDATLGLQGAALDASGVINDEFIASMVESMEAAGLSEEAIGLVEDALRGVGEAGEDIEDEYRTSVTVTGDDKAISDLEAIQREINSVDRFIEIHLRGITSDLIAEQAPVPGTAVPRQHGGPIDEGPHGVDRVPAMLTRGEHVWTVREVQAAGGHEAVEAMRAAVLAGQSRTTVAAPVGTPRGGDGARQAPAAGVHVDELHVQAWSDRFDLGQVEDELSMAGAV